MDLFDELVDFDKKKPAEDGTTQVVRLCVMLFLVDV